MVRISDARMSGTAYGTVVLHVAPEAAAGGPLGIVRDGDWIELDCENGRLHLDISDEEIKARLADRPRAGRRRQPATSAVPRPRAAGRRGLRFRFPGRLPRLGGSPHSH
jgi:dihydroxyacid dehydratase/phosphogluconate dehydratase